MTQLYEDGEQLMKVEAAAGGRAENVSEGFQDGHLRHAKWMSLGSC